MADRPRFMLTLPTPHEATWHMARVLSEEGMLGTAVVPLNGSRLPALPRALALRINIDQWRYPFPATSGAAVQELVAAAGFRLLSGHPNARGMAKMATWRAAALDRSAARRLRSGSFEAVSVLHGRTFRAAVTARKGGVPILYFLNSDPWAMSERLAALADSAPDEATRREIQEELEADAVQHANRSVGRATAIVVESTRMAEQVRHAGFKAPAIVLGQGVDAKFFVPAPRQAGERPLRIVQVSRILHCKGLAVTNDAVRLAGPAVESAVVPGWNANGARVLVSNCTALQFTGGLARTGVREMLQRADIFVLPTYADPMPRAVFEAMACGLPVITTTDSGYGDVIEHGVNGFIVPLRNPQAVAALITRLSGDPELRERVGTAARATAEANSWEHFAENFRRKLYSEVLPALGLQAEPRASDAADAVRG